MDDVWDPTRYGRFASERERPFHDLLALVRPVAGPRVVDLGCGTGKLTAHLHRALGPRASTLGLDRSAAMLARAAEHAGREHGASGLAFAEGDLADDAAWSAQAAALDGEPAERGFDVVFSNAALHWVDDHPALLARLAARLAPGGQLAVQVPANHDHVSHATASELAREEPFRSALGGFERRSPVLAPRAYAELLHGLGLAEQRVRLEVYAHELAGLEALVEWVRGTTLTAYEERLPAELRPDFVARYGEVLATRLPDVTPLFFPFPRVLLWARRGSR